MKQTRAITSFLDEQSEQSSSSSDNDSDLSIMNDKSSKPLQISSKLNQSKPKQPTYQPPQFDIPSIPVMQPMLPLPSLTSSQFQSYSSSNSIGYGFGTASSTS